MAHGRPASAPNPSIGATQDTPPQTRCPCECHGCKCNCTACSCRTKPVPNKASRQQYNGEGTHVWCRPEDDIVLDGHISEYPESFSSIASSGGSLGFNNSFEVRGYIDTRLTNTNLAQHDIVHRAQDVRERTVVDEEDVHDWRDFLDPDSSGMIGAENMEIDSVRPAIGSGGNTSMYASHHDGALSRGTPSVTTSQMIIGAGDAFGGQIHQFLSLTPDCRHVRTIPLCRCGRH
ncbi:hypothetical protein EDD37DRAFT_311680 [Exophiala viscosa]|uniref:Uncharacterized protein n=1 Tax=Exophiala viscosa TaxID=2486360 RepID=A0AAN6DUY2_9EURO|nr:hypothetical protein EDD36DRAFT_418748 [Exophiala viscosa]KAI1625657.1 hypothetical protein EDD37DRAFT_311680 [Exophiala viscosa]